MSLNARQLFTLEEMGIPVWISRAQTTSDIDDKEDLQPFIDVSDTLLNSRYIVLIEQQKQPAQQKLLQAILSALDLDRQKIAFISREQVIQLDNIECAEKVLFVFGEELAQSALSLSVKRGDIQPTLKAKIATIVSFSLEVLLEKPENKALAWQDLQQMKHVFY